MTTEPPPNTELQTQDTPRPSPEAETRLLRRKIRRTIAAAAIGAHLLGILSSFDAVMSTRTSQGAVAWVISLNTFPWLAVPAYWVFGRTKFQGYVIGRQADDSVLHAAVSEKLDRLREHAATFPPEARHLKVIERLAKMPMVGGNRAELLIDGDATFSSMYAGIEAAERYVLMQFYIVRNDSVGNAFQRLLMRKAREGVKVYFLYDEIGSHRLPGSWLREMAASGVEVRRFHSTQGRGNRFQLNFRNHRKILVTDGTKGWVGGLNLGDEYLGRDPRIGPWRDTHLKLEGPAALSLQLSFAEDWHWAAGALPELDWDPVPAEEPGLPVLVLPSGPADRFETASLMAQNAIHSAQHRLWISSPYFVPDEGVIAALKLAAFRGVDVRVLIPERPDNILTYFAAYAFLGPLLEAGVAVHRYEDGFLHAKTMLIDDDRSAVGTVNFDNRSFRLNFEITAWVVDEGFATGMEAMFSDDFSRARQMVPEDVFGRPLWFRALSRAAHLTAPLL